MPKQRSLPPGFEETFNRALSLSRDGQHQNALDLLHQLDRAVPDDAPVLGTIGGILLHETGNSSEALPYLRRAAELAPSSERASVGLFHCLWHEGRHDAAFDEMRRFLKNYASPEYERLLQDMNEDNSE